MASSPSKLTGWTSGPVSPRPPPPRETPPAGTVHELLEQAKADGVVTQSEWTQVRAAADAQPHVASDAAREILGAWAADSFKVEDAAKSGMRSYLRSCGYDVPSSSRPGQAIDPILATNVGEPDRDFAAIQALAGKSAESTTIAILDAGIDTGHAELASKEWVNEKEIAGNGIDDDADGKIDDVHGWDFVDADAETRGHIHGTHVSGIATRGTDSVKTISCRVFNDTSGPQLVADAIDYAAAHGARIMNMSFTVSTPEEVRVIGEAIRRHPEVLFVKSAGNDGRQIDGGSYKPESYLPYNLIPNMAVVSAAEPDGRKAGYSNYGAPYSTHAVQGSSVFSTVDDGRYQSMDGTSMAAPNFTAVAAKCLNLNPALDPVALKGILSDTSTQRADWAGKTASGGLLDEHAAIRVAALTGLVAGGATVEEAADQLQLSGDERTRLIEIAARYLPAPT